MIPSHHITKIIFKKIIIFGLLDINADPALRKSLKQPIKNPHIKVIYVTMSIVHNSTIVLVSTSLCLRK